MKRPTAGPVAWCLVAAALFGASTPVAKWLLDDLGPFTLAGLLYLGAAVAVAPMSRRGGSRERRAQPAHMMYLAASVLFGGVAGPVLLLFGLQQAQAASVSLWLNLETVATAALAYFIFREHFGLRTWLATACVLGAGVLLAVPFDGGTTAAALLVGLACVCWGIDNNVTSLIDGYTPAQSTLIKGAVAGILNLSAGVLIEGNAPALLSVGAALLVGGLGYGLSIMLYIQGAQHLGATRSQMLFATAPLCGLAVAWTALGEPIAWNQLAAIGPMTIGLALLMSSTHEHPHTHTRARHSHSHRHDDGHHDHLHAGKPPWLRHTHEHEHEPVVHTHDHVPDLHHRHDHA